MENYIYNLSASWILVLCMTFVLKIPGCHATCGGYITAAETDTGTIMSPSYPSNYGNNVMCIWLVEARSGYAVSLTITGVEGESDNSSSTACSDYVEIRNGSSEQTVQYYECESTTTQTVQARWLWVKFRSNYQNANTGFTSAWNIVADESTSSASKPYVDCPMEYKCANKECVPMSYRCDGYVDCGCEESSCDEVGCGGFDFTAGVKLGIGIGVGAGFFLITFFGIGLLEICLKNRAEQKYKDRLELHKKLLKQKKAKAMAALFVTQTSTDGSRTSGSLRVPSLSTVNESTSNVHM